MNNISVRGTRRSSPTCGLRRAKWPSSSVMRPVSSTTGRIGSGVAANSPSAAVTSQAKGCSSTSRVTSRSDGAANGLSKVVMVYYSNPLESSVGPAHATS
jgi:hypothetical protein